MTSIFQDDYFLWGRASERSTAWAGCETAGTTGAEREEGDEDIGMLGVDPYMVEAQKAIAAEILETPPTEEILVQSTLWPEKVLSLRLLVQSYMWPETVLHACLSDSWWYDQGSARFKVQPIMSCMHSCQVSGHVPDD